ncbi:hypothetical protein HBI70_209700 [Parastagonospora nodorum]|nr:hypothetical protein HBH50_090840 [Parastagonospora nodorum]KAH4081321.1 hypothetical protein HBH46_226770 [Parastagonospora nodorum]KAH4092817.1 hypothetical protein HBH48_072550 [Parastagonospora nodorum]KAH4413703.1 hypothetical protein HBH92_096800 [Parastagonospora nodorum]KAH4417354.1 hypothetical protein HBH93_209290 [Parastagonospora nodorum]
MDSNPVNGIPPSVLADLAREDQGPKTIGLIATFLALAFIAVCLRFVARIRLGIPIGWEDYFILVSMTCSILASACQIMQVHHGFGKHQVFVDLPSTILALKYLYFGILCYGISFTFIKISILTQYERIFSVKATRIPIYMVMGISVAGGIAALFTFMFACVPVDAFWNVLKQPEARCIDLEKAEYGLGTLNTVTDLMIAALPVRAIWRLQIVRSQKIALVMILSLGWFVSIVSIFRITSLAELAHHPDDQSFYSAAPIYWASTEMNLAMVCACAPSLKPLISRIVPGFASRDMTVESGQRSRTRGSRLSSVGRSFQKLSGRDGSKGGSNSSRITGNTEEQGMEMTVVTALSPTQRSDQEEVEPGRIIIMNEIDQRSDRRTSDASSRRILQGQSETV